MVSDNTVGKKVLCCLYLKRVDENALEIPFFLLSHSWGLEGLAALIVESPFLLFMEPSDPFLE